MVKDSEEHKCLHEVDLATMAQSQKRTEELVDEVLRLLKGDNKHGLVTRVALLRQSIGRVWWWVGGISISIMGIAFVIIRAFLLKGGN